ncbi:MAG: FkbM family methyltransferase [Alphaproteobacteria bacterium]
MPMDLYPIHLATWPRSTVEAAIRRRVQTAYLGDGLVLARILGRHKIFLRSADRGFACHLMLDGFWEIWLTQFLARRVKPGITAIDVGANFGYFTLLLGDLVGSAGHVVAVEPNPEAAALLQESVLLNGHRTRTTVVPHALGASAGRGWLYAPDGEPKNAALVADENLPGGRTVEVATLTLDEVALPYRKVDLVKIDAEGGEEGIIAGMRQLIARDRPTIVLEFNAARYADPRRFLDELLASYGTARELSLHGKLLPLDRASVLDQTSREDRTLLFE